MENVAAFYQRTHERVLKAVEESSEREIAWRPNSTTPSIGFHLWHLARWADYLQELVNGPGSQIWDKEGLAERWGFNSSRLGYAQTGMGMDDDVSSTLPLPSKAVLIDYARRVFEVADKAVSSIADDQYFKEYRDEHREEPKERMIGNTIMGWITHDGRHHGMIECLRGMLRAPETKPS